MVCFIILRNEIRNLGPIITHPPFGEFAILKSLQRGQTDCRTLRFLAFSLIRVIQRRGAYKLVNDEMITRLLRANVLVDGNKTL